MARKKVKKSDAAKAKLTNKEVEEMVINLAKDNTSLAKIGQILKDTYGISSVAGITGAKIKKILSENKIKREIPEDLQNLVKKSDSLKKHLEKNKQDKTAERGLKIAESNIRKLARYYKRKGFLPKSWQY